MKIIIPMTGYGSRFIVAGYKKLKPFIEVQGKSIIEWIVKGMYSEEDEFLFICRKEHIEKIPNMKKQLLNLAPKINIFEIEQWEKKGPVFDILKAQEMIRDDEECIINYCDFFMIWNYKKFKEDIKKSNCDGCIPCYTGFHPHLLKKENYYASCLTDENNYLIEIREKFSFEADKTKSNHSPGVYYFKSGYLLKKYCSMLVESKQMINNEYYASLPYNFMVNDNLKILVDTQVSYFCQWGTPEDLEEYLFWTNSILNRDNIKIKKSYNFDNTYILIPMAGAGQRFTDAGYSTSKPAILTTDRKTGNNFPMVVCAVLDLPCVKAEGENIIFIDRDFHKIEGVEDEIKKNFKKAQFVTIDKLTQGQACTCLLGTEKIDPECPLLIAGCDNGMDFDNGDFYKLQKECDVIVFTYKNNEAVLENPQAYGWIKTDNNNNIVDVSIKKPISNNPMKDHAVVATFWFKKGRYFIEAAKKMIQENDKINDEFYVDQAIKHILELGYRAKVFEINKYICWGTPNDYKNYCKTLEYWTEFEKINKSI